MSAGAFSDLLPRTIAGLVLGVVTLAAAWFGGLWFAVLMALAAGAMIWELRRMVDAPSGGAAWLVIVLTAAAVVVTELSLLRFGLLTILGAVLAAIWLDGRKRGWTVPAIAWIGISMACVDALRADPSYGFEAVLWLFLTVIATDVGGYFGGRVVGGPKLWPRVSPKKTWAGLVTGMACAAIAGSLFARWTTGTFAGEVMIVSALIAVVSQGGDLLESVVKRRFDAKDASRLIPGHGGVLDRLDGLMAAALVCGAITFARGKSIFIW